MPDRSLFLALLFMKANLNLSRNRERSLQEKKLPFVSLHVIKTLREMCNFICGVEEEKLLLRKKQTQFLFEGLRLINHTK